MNRRQAFTAWRHSRGFSLVEVMLALAIVGIGLVTILGLLPSGFTSARKASDTMLAGMIAHDLISEIKSQPATNVTVCGWHWNLVTMKDYNDASATLWSCPSKNYYTFFDANGNWISAGTNGYFLVDVFFPGYSDNFVSIKLFWNLGNGTNSAMFAYVSGGCDEKDKFVGASQGSTSFYTTITY